MEKAFKIHKELRENSEMLTAYMNDLQNWEAEMKRKEAALSGDFEQVIPPVRSKLKKEKPVLVKKKPEKRILASDYKSWDKFDADKACEDVDMQGVGPTSLDSKKSEAAKMEKLRDEAQYEKERGNNFVKQEKWDEAISCYNRAIELVKDDAIYYANRGLCYLKKDSLHQAELDCTEALRLDQTYVKAYQRRATARERLGSLRAASNDLLEVLKLEPKNKAAYTQLEQIKARMGTKGSKSKSSPSTTPNIESKPFPKGKTQPKIVELEDTKGNSKMPERDSAVDNWRNGVGENVTVLRPVKKPPHLRSKRALKPVTIHEIPLYPGNTTPEKPPTRLKIEELESDNKDNALENHHGDIIESKASPESVKLISEALDSEKASRVASLVPPVSSVQFMNQWKYLRGNDEARSDYLSIIDPSKIPSIFAMSLESEVFSDVLRLLRSHTQKFKRVSSYLIALSRVQRFSALAMFLSTSDKQLITSLLDHCKSVEHLSENELADLKNKYEL